MTIGEDRVRVKFNPSSDDLVSQIKQKSAELIDLCQSMKVTAFSISQDKAVELPSERNRCFALAQTAYEDAAMWAVKGATADV